MVESRANDPGEEERLKRLLFGDEIDLLGRIAARTDNLDSRVGDDRQMAASVRRVLVDVLREAGIADSDRVAEALAPLVLATVREEIHVSTDSMVEALKPSAGALGWAALSQAASGAARAADRAVKPHHWFGRAERRQRQRFRVERLLLLHRPTGRELADSADADGAEGSSALPAAGLRAAILSIVREPAPESADGSVRHAPYAGRDLYIRVSSRLVLAAVASGPRPGDLDDRLDRIFLALVGRWSETIRAADGPGRPTPPPALSAELEAERSKRFGATGSRREDTRPSRPLIGSSLLILLVSLAIGGLVYLAATTGIGAWREARLTTALTGDPALSGWPLTVDRQGWSRFSVAGTLPANLHESVRMRAGDALPAADIRYRLAAFPDQPTGAPETAELRTRIADLEATVAALSASVDPLAPARLWLEGQTIRFASAVRYRDPGRADAVLSAVARLLASWDGRFRLRIVGYADSGDRQAARTAAQRADLVRDALVARGTPASRLIALGRADEAAPGPTGDPANDRVAFEIDTGG